ncbi:ABC transporter ATP-binding protein/permease [Nakamurella sp.]|uniref:ABC transporter ATP-binding protein/permease n=1 Tax=Nakamurella sp. TaxID=1869182 RepID=UPI003B3AC838
MFHRRLLQLLPEVRGPVSLCVLAGLAVTLSYLAQAVVLAAALTALAAGDGAAVSRWLAVVGVVVALRAGLIWLRELVVVRCGAAVRIRLRATLLDRVGRLGPDAARRMRSGAVRGVLLEGVDGLDPYFSRYLPQLVITAIVPASLVGWMYTVWAPAAAVLTGAVLLVLVVPRLKDASLLRTGRHRWESYLAIAADYLEAVQGLPTLRAFGAAGRRRDGLQARSDALYRDTMRELRVSLVENGISAALVVGGTAAAIAVTAWGLWGGTGLATGPGGIAVMVLVLLVATECFRPVRDLTAAWHAGYLGLTAVDGLDAVLSATPAVPDAGTATRPEPDRPPTIELVGAGLRYPATDRWALRGIDLRIPAGSMLAVVGASGAGKSTLARLLARALDPTDGAVRFDGIDLTALSLSRLRATVATVEQDPFLFSGTVLENLRLGAPAAGRAAVAAAIRAAGAQDVLDAVPGGLDGLIAEGGRSLSGGQRQRLALARALVRGAPLLILDEVTAHLDHRAEGAVTDTLAALRGRHTLVVIAHRLSTVRDADQVAVLAGGRLVQLGRFDDLAGRPGPLAELLAAREVLV